uniref:Uncharacterized protein n=1 Tax=Setaria italica TaxID=4555 RepID=K4APC9_SETIT
MFRTRVSIPTKLLPVHFILPVHFVLLPVAALHYSSLHTHYMQLQLYRILMIYFWLVEEWVTR